MYDTSCVVQVIPSAASGLHSLCAERLFVRFPCCVTAHARQPQVRPSTFLSHMHVHNVLMHPLCPGPRPCCVRQESLLQLATMCMCVCAVSFFVGWCAQLHTPPSDEAATPTRPMQVSAPCLPDCIHACAHRVARSYSICTAADTSMAAQSILLLIHADTDTPPVRTPCLHVNHISVSCPHACCLHRSPAVLRFRLNHFVQRFHVLCHPCSAPVPRPSPQHHPHTMYVYPCVLH
jgi:hypothetical protein